MNLETILHYIDVYGYVIIFLFLFFGIVGIPAPEESLLFLIGVVIAHHKLSFGMSVLSAILGAFIGMLTAYICGKYIGSTFINKYGKYIGITIGRWKKAQDAYAKNVHKAIMLGFYMPGIRQISPYLAGMTKTPFWKFFLLALLGTLLWTVSFIVAGYYAGKAFPINPAYVPFLGVIFLAVFLLYVFIQYMRKKRKSSPR